MTTELVWGALLHVAKSFKPATPGETRGQLEISSEDDLAALKLCLQHQNDTGMQLRSGAQDPVRGDSVAISFEPRRAFGSIVKDMEALLQVPGARVRERRRFLLLDGLVSSNEQADENSEIGRYRLVLQLVQSLRNVAAFLDSDESNLVFIGGGRFDVPVVYSAEDLRRIDIALIKELITLVPTDTHKKQCNAILAAAIVDVTKALPAAARFSHLLAHAGDLREAYDQGYKLYASGFSYDKLKDTVEAARVEYAGKIHKVFSDIQNQLLGIPVATIVVATQMKNANGFGYEFFVNTAVLVGCWVFAALTILLIRNQKHTLKVLKDEIDRQQRQMQNEFAAIADSFAGAFAFLRERARAQTVVLWVIDAVVLAGLLGSHIVYAYLTPDAWTWVRAQMHL